MNKIKSGIVIINLMITPKKSNWLTEGEHLVNITKVAEEHFGNGEACLALNFADNKGREHNQYFPLVGFKTFEEEEDAKVKDALTKEERNSGMYIQEEGKSYAQQVAKKDAKGKLVELPKPVRVISQKKSEAAQAIIARLACNFGFAENVDIDAAELEGAQGVITIKKVSTPDGMFNRVVATRAITEEELA